MYRVPSSQDDQSYLSAPSPNTSNHGSSETYIDPSPIATSSNGTDFTDLDEVDDHHSGNTSGTTCVSPNHPQTIQQPDLSVGEVNKAGVGDTC